LTVLFESCSRCNTGGELYLLLSSSSKIMQKLKCLNS